MSASRETVADVTSLIMPSGGVGGEGKRQQQNMSETRSDDEIVMNHISPENFNSRSSGRCTTEARSDRHIDCNKDSVSITDHNHCKKNVNNSNMKELNKALVPLAHLSPSSRGTVARDHKSFSNGARCVR